MNLFLRLLTLIFLLFVPGTLIAAPTTGKITLYYSNDVHAATEPCG